VDGIQSEEVGVMNWKNLVLLLASLAMVASLTACGSSGQGSADKQEPPKKEAPKKQIAPDNGLKEKKNKEKKLVAKRPEDRTLKLTVPKMKRIDKDTIPTGTGTRMKLFHDYAGVHLAGTDFPWRKQGNVYIAGHRLGFENTDSWLAFHDLEVLEKGDKVYVTDANGTKYTYVVFVKKIVKPTDLSVLRPVKGKSILSLQTCTLPDYKDRVVYQAELKDVQET